MLGVLMLATVELDKGCRRELSLSGRNCVRSCMCCYYVHTVLELPATSSGSSGFSGNFRGLDANCTEPESTTCDDDRGAQRQPYRQEASTLIDVALSPGAKHLLL